MGKKDSSVFRGENDEEIVILIFTADFFGQQIRQTKEERKNELEKQTLVLFPPFFTSFWKITQYLQQGMNETNG